MMCAIAGIIGLPADEKTLGAMLQSMHRRGPDAEGIYETAEAIVLHSRLIIRDPEGGKQPMHLTWAGEKYTIVYNGELYNTEEIRKELEEAGHTFLGYSDTEVVLHAYAQYGEGCLSRFNGIFAFGVWEEKRKRLFLARDRIGVKPLFYMRHAGGLLFASEMKTILEYPTVQARLDEQGASQLILLGPGRLPGSGVFRDIEEIEPGCCAFYEDGRLNGRRYWKLTDGEHRESFEETIEHVRIFGDGRHPAADGFRRARGHLPVRRSGFQHHHGHLRTRGSKAGKGLKNLLRGLPEQRAVLPKQQIPALSRQCLY